MNRKQKGSFGEQQAERFLQKNGYAVLAKNFRSIKGEVDIIATRGEEIVFVEVKYGRTYDPSSLEYSVDAKKQKRIIDTSKYFLLKHPEYNLYQQKYDVIFFSGITSEILHIDNAFNGDGYSW